MLLLGRGGVRVVGGFGRVRDCAEHRRHVLLFLYSQQCSHSRWCSSWFFNCVTCICIIFSYTDINEHDG